MPVFKYKVRQNNKMLHGTMEAKDAHTAALLLRERGLLVIDISEPTNLSLETLSKIFSHVSFADLATMTRSLSTLIASGLPLLECLVLLQGQVESPVLKDTVAGLRHEVEGGSSLAKAMEKYPHIFNKLYISLIKTGEAAGMLDKVLKRLAENLEKQKEFRSKIKGALIYPVIIVLGMTVVAFIMMIFVIPQLLVLYKDLNVELPAVTKILISISSFFQLFWWVILAGLAGLAALYRSFRQTETGRLATDRWMAKIPVLGKLKEKATLTEVARTLGLLIGAGVSLIEALRLVGSASDNLVIGKALEGAAQKVEKGFPLSMSLVQTEIFPPIMIQMIKVGEETGKLDDSLLKLSSYFESETEELIKGLTTAIEPFIMIVLGIGVGFLVISIILPIYKLTSSL